MALKVAIQMDPIDAIDIDADSTFRIAEEAQSRGHELFYYTPDMLAYDDGKVTARGHRLTLRREKGNHFSLGETETVDLADWDVVWLRQDPPFDMGYITGLPRPHPTNHNRPRSGNSQSLPRSPWRRDPQAALWQWRRGRLQVERHGQQHQLAPRALRRHQPRAAHHPEIPARRGRRRQARIGPLLKEQGQIFVGIDVIGGNLTEINVTSPTGIQELERFDGIDVAGRIWDAIEAKR